MKLVTSSYDLSTQQWSTNLPTDLDSPQLAIFAFGDSKIYDDPEPISALRESFPQAQFLGCSTAGEIHGARVFDGGLSVAFARFEKCQLKVADAALNSEEDSFSAGVKLAENLAQSDLRAVFVLCDGLKVNGSELVRGLNSVLPQSVAITGGLAGDDDKFKRTWVIRDKYPQSNYVTALGLYGKKLRISHGSKGGWDVFGVERKVTSSSRNILFTLDDRPALALYKEYLGDRASGLPGTALLFPLALRTPDNESQTVVRTVLSINEEDQSMTFAGDIPEGSYARLMRANFDRLIIGASDAASLATFRTDTTGPSLSIAISCVGRRLVLGERTEEETEAALEVLPKNTQQVGFYSYGELSPHANGRCDLHNQTMTLTLLGEEDAE